VGRQRGSIGRWIFGMLLAGGLPAAPAQQVPAQTQVTYDGSLNGLPGHTGTPITTSGPTTTIPQGIGATSGNNLFHSFGLFDVSAGDTVDFTGAAHILNIIARVTGGQQSDIYGSLRSSINAANLYLFNPAGIVFGPDATLDLSGSFNISTADYLDFANGARFSADASSPALIDVNPTNFGFLGAPAGSITLDAAKLSVPGHDISVVASDFNIINGGQLSSGGNAIGDAGDITVNVVNLAIDGTPDSIAGIFSDAGSGSSGRITIAATGDVTLEDGARITSISTGSGNGVGDIEITAGNLTLDGGATGVSGIQTLGNAGTPGHTGNITVSATGDVTLKNNGLIISVSNGPAHGGDITIASSNFTIANGFTGILASADPDSTGGVGNIAVSVRRNATLRNGGFISSNTFGRGDAGNIQIAARNLMLDGSGEFGGAAITSQASFDSVGDAGNVTIAATRTVTIKNGGSISAFTIGPGDAGDVQISTRNLTVDQAGIDSQAIPGSSGNGGNITVSATENVIFKHGAVLSSRTEGSGDAGDVHVTAANLKINGAGTEFTGILADSSSEATGDAGQVEVSATRNLTMKRGGAILTDTAGIGDGGSILIEARRISMRDSRISSNSNSTEPDAGQAGTVLLSATHLLDLRHSSIRTASVNADGGTIGIQVPHTSRPTAVLLANSEINASAESGSGRGGNIFLDPDLLVLYNSQIRADSLGGPGGNVSIITNGLIRDPASAITASSGVGMPGTVTIE
jgi:filamentous hemagglutinin family protein